MLIVFMGGLTALVFMTLLSFMYFQNGVYESLHIMGKKNEYLTRKVKRLERQIHDIERLVERTLKNAELSSYIDDVTCPSVGRIELMHPMRGEITRLDKLNEELTELKSAIAGKWNE